MQKVEGSSPFSRFERLVVRGAVASPVASWASPATRPTLRTRSKHRSDEPLAPEKEAAYPRSRVRQAAGAHPALWDPPAQPAPGTLQAAASSAWFTSASASAFCARGTER